MAKILQISNYPPPMCGWAMQTKLLVDELRARGETCEVLNINESRKIKSPEYVDVQNGLDYLLKVLRFAFRGYRFHLHVNGESKKGYLLALIAALAGRMTFQPSLLTFHGGIPQTYFPHGKRKHRLAFKVLFGVAGSISCNSDEIAREIIAYGVPAAKISAIPTFSPQVMRFERKPIAAEVQTFLAQHSPVFFSYVCMRSEFRLPVYRGAMREIRRHHPRAGFLWLGFPQKELPSALEYIGGWSEDERASVLALGNVDHDQFLTLLERCFAYIRTPACDGVSTSVLESLSLGIPVIASENQRRPEGVVTYGEMDSGDLAAKALYVIAEYEKVRSRSRFKSEGDNTQRTADLLLGCKARSEQEDMALVP